MDRSRVIHWHPCTGFPGADCGTLKLPINWADPDGPTFALALARRKATNPAERIGSLIVDPGGPGGSGLAEVVRKDPFPPDLRARFDIVGFDPRGSGASDPITCDARVVAAVPAANPATPAGLADLKAYNRRLAADCERRSGPMFSHVDDLSVIRDIDAIRAALGEAKLSFMGVSYGTLMGQQYAEMFPNRVRALVLDSNEDHSIPGTTVGTSTAASAEDSFTQFTRWCAAAAKCVLHGRDIGRLFDRLYARALSGHLTVPGHPRQKVPAALLITLTEEYLATPDWPGLATALAAAAAGPATPASPPHGTPFPEKIDVYVAAVICADWSVNVSTARQVAVELRRMNAVAPHMHLDARTWESALACLGRPGSLTNPPRPYRVSRILPPILMINSLHDPETPYAWALDVAHQIPPTTLVTYDGWGHGVYRQSPCAQRIVDTYLISLRLPPRGTHCPAIVPGKSS